MLDPAFLFAAGVLALTPGPGIAYVLARTVTGGRTEGLSSCAGAAIGGMVHVGAAAAGLSFVIAQSAFWFSLVKYLGAAYLVYLGVRALMASRTPTDQAPAGDEGEAPTANSPGARGAWRALVDGAVVEALNVKTALFFLAFLPQFIAADRAVTPQLILMGVTCVGLNTLMDLLVVFTAHRLMANGASRAARSRWMQRASGLTLLGLGAWLALARRH